MLECPGVCKVNTKGMGKSRGTETQQNTTKRELSEYSMGVQQKRCYPVLWASIWTLHYSDVITSAMASQIIDVSNVFSSAYSGAYPKKTSKQWNGNFSALLVPCMGIHQSPVDSPNKGQRREALMFYSAIFLTYNPKISVCLSWILHDWYQPITIMMILICLYKIRW